MVKRTDIVSMLKTLNIEQLRSDGLTSVFFSLDGVEDKKTFALSVQNEFITVTTGKFLFKRKYRIHKNEL
jgi:hypothetical protein